MDFTDKELAVLNQMITIALLSGEVDFDEDTKSIHKKVSGEILKRSAIQCTTKQ